MGAGLDFSITQKTLERLEWPRIAARLAAAARTPRGRASLAPPPGGDAADGFAPSLEAAARTPRRDGRGARDPGAPATRRRWAGSARSRRALARARKGGTLAAEALLDLRGTLAALRETAGFFEARREQAPRLAQLAAAVREQAALERRIEAALEPSGELRDSASPELAAGPAREPERLGGDPAAARAAAPGSRPALPSLRRLLHGAQRPLRAAGARRGEGRRARHPPRRLALGDHGLRRARGAGRSQQPAPAVRARGGARGAARAGGALGGGRRRGGRDRGGDLGAGRRRPRVRARRARAGAARDAPRGRHARASCAPSGCAIRCFRWTRPSATTSASARATRCWCSPGRTPGARRSRSSPSRSRRSACARASSCRRSPARGSTSSTRCSPTSATSRTSARASPPSPRTWPTSRASSRQATPRSLVVLDEIGTGTDPIEGAAVAQAVLEALADRGARVITTTHFNLLKEMAEVTPGFANASFEFDPETLAPTYRLRVGHPGASSALAVAARMGLHPGVLARANQLLDREDRRLDRMLSELAASRAALEQRAAGGGACADGERGGARRVRGEALGAPAAARDALPLDARGSRARLPRGAGTGRRRDPRAAERRLGARRHPRAATARRDQSRAAGGRARGRDRGRGRIVGCSAPPRRSTGDTPASATPSRSAAGRKGGCSRCPISGAGSRWAWAARA